MLSHGRPILMRVRISFDALRLCLLVAAGVTSGYLWRAAFESSIPFEQRKRMLLDLFMAEMQARVPFVRAFERLGAFRGEAKLSTWLHAIATSVVLNGLRKVKRFRQRETDLDEAAGTSARGRAAEPDLKRRLAQAIDGLPDGYRTVFVMHDVEGYTHEEIGAILGIESGTSKAQLSRARAKLRDALADFAGEWVS